MLSGCVDPTNSNVSEPNGPSSIASSQSVIRVVPSGVEPEKRQISREVYPQNNCGGVAEVTSTFSQERAITYILNLGQEITLSADGTIGIPTVGNIQIGTEVATHYNVSYGKTETKSSQLALKAKEGTKVEHVIKHVELWDRGTVIVTVSSSDYSYPYQFPIGYRLELEETIQLPCPSSTTVITSTSESGITAVVTIVNTPVMPEIVPTPIPSTIGTIVVPGSSNLGVKFASTASGFYTFRYVSGSYSTYPAGNTPSDIKSWLTAIRIFKNRDVEWNGIAISDFPDVNLSDFNFNFTAAEAEAKAKGSSTTIQLQEGDYLILVGVDGKPDYSDNPGEVVLEVLYVPE